MIRVLVVDDSRLSRRLVARVLHPADDITIVGEAEDAYAAREQIVALQPDVVVLDNEMPRMDGVTFLEVLTRHYPSQVVLCSSTIEEGGEAETRALAAGAAAIIRKPGGGYRAEAMARDLIAAVRHAAAAGWRAVGALAGRGSGPPVAISEARRSRPSLLGPDARPPVQARGANDAGEGYQSIIAIGASTGGTAAIERIVRRLLSDTPAVLIVQHLPEYIVPAFAERLGRLTRVPVEVATDGMLVRAGTVTIAPGGRHMAAESVGSEVRLRLQNKEKVNGHRPAVDVLFGSLARVAGKDALGVLLTGMGRDGAEGLLAMHQSGARTVVQDEASSVVWGMPKAAIEVGAAQEVLSLSHLVERIAHAGMRRRPTWRPMRQPR